MKDIQMHRLHLGFVDIITHCESSHSVTSHWKTFRQSLPTGQTLCCSLVVVTDGKCSPPTQSDKSNLSAQGELLHADQSFLLVQRF